MRHRLSLVAVAAVLAALVWAPAAAAATRPALRPAAPKVVLIVGPVGETTAEYRQLAEQAAGAAREFTPNVVEVYSPDATWPAVRNALQGAAVVVYLGHGNGWPSPYRSSLYPPSQDGFGLNPVAGVDDDAHQYFGEDRIATEVQLATNAVVILSRLCYASGNSEPGLDEGTPAVARQRVDNYAAGFIAAGAGAVIAEAHAGPAWYVRHVLSARGSIERMWSSAPTSNGHVTRFESSRSPGFVGRLDPDQAASGFYRSIVLRPGLSAVPRRGTVARVLPSAAESTLAGMGLTLGVPKITGRPMVGTTTKLSIHYETSNSAQLPDGIQIGVRWDPIDVPAPDSEPSTGDTIADLVTAERPGSVVEPVPAKVGKSTLAIPLGIPALSGRYRLVITLHDTKKDAFGAATQALVRNAIVRVTGTVDAAVEVEPAITTVISAPVALPVSVTNLGVAAWGREAVVGRRPRPGEGASSALLVARWIPLDPSQLLAPDVAPAVFLPAALAPAARADVVFELVAPASPGAYLLMLDVVTPADGSLTSRGIDPSLVRVTVTAPLH